VARLHRRTSIAILAGIVVLCVAGPAGAQGTPTIDAFLSPAYPFELVAAKKADRVAWISYERGRRNVYTAVGPDFRPVQLTGVQEDDGNDLSSLQISDEGAVIVFVRGHAPNRDGWVANPLSDPNGAERAVWAVRTGGGPAWRIGESTSPVLSPDGRSVAFARGGQIYCLPVGDAAPASPVDKGEKPLVTAWGNNGNPVWSPDSSMIAFVSNRGDHSLIAVYDVKARKLRYLSPGVDRDTSPTWSPDGKRIAFIRRPGLPFGQQSQAGTGGIGNPPGPAVGRAGAPGQQQGRGAPPAAAGPVAPIRGLMSATFTGGHTLAFWVADVATGEAIEFWRNESDETMFTNINAIQWAGGSVIFQAEPEEWIRYYSVSVSGATPRPVELTPGDGMVESVSLSSDGRTLYYSTNAGDIDRRHVWKVATAGGTAVQLTKGETIETYPAVLASEKHLALLSADARRPQSVAVVAATGGDPKIVFPTLPGEFPLSRHVVPQNVTLTAEDGVQFNNQLFLPKDLRSGERRPAVVFVHGGPVRQMLLGYHYRWFYHVAYGVNQWLADQGYVVLSVNFRSGIGYGKSFRTAPNTGARGNSEYQDVLAAGRYLQSRPDVDPERIGIWGLSYGGLLTAQALARNSDIFKVGIDLAGVHLFGNSLDPASVSFQSSAISQMENWKSPVLLVHGDDDRNVAFTQTTGLVQLLRAHDIYHELIVFPDDVHDSLVHGRWIYTFERMDAFLKRFLKAPPTFP
jgi:dipeptidyl-peptidase 4